MWRAWDVKLVVFNPSAIVASVFILLFWISRRNWRSFQLCRGMFCQRPKSPNLKLEQQVHILSESSLILSITARQTTGGFHSCDLKLHIRERRDEPFHRERLHELRDHSPFVILSEVGGTDVAPMHIRLSAATKLFRTSANCLSPPMRDMAVAGVRPVCLVALSPATLSGKI